MVNAITSSQRASAGLLNNLDHIINVDCLVFKIAAL